MKPSTNAIKHRTSHARMQNHLITLLSPAAVLVLVTVTGCLGGNTVALSQIYSNGGKNNPWKINNPSQPQGVPAYQAVDKYPSQENIKQLDWNGDISYNLGPENWNTMVMETQWNEGFPQQQHEWNYDIFSPAAGDISSGPIQGISASLDSKEGDIVTSKWYVAGTRPSALTIAENQAKDGGFFYPFRPSMSINSPLYEHDKWHIFEDNTSMDGSRVHVDSAKLNWKADSSPEYGDQAADPIQTHDEPSNDWKGTRSDYIEYGGLPLCQYEYEYNDDAPYSGCTGTEDQYYNVCNLAVCFLNCKKHFGFEEGACIENECYCKKKEDIPQQAWTYDNQESWSKKYPNCGENVGQSPINIKKFTINDATKIQLRNYDANVSLILENTGYLAMMYIQSRVLPSIDVKEEKGDNTRGVVKPKLDRGTYALARMDLHWGSSEHKLDGESFDMEAHLHHFDMSISDTYEQALTDKATLSVALLFKIDSTSDLSDDLFNAMESIRVPENVGLLIGPDRFFKGLEKGMTDVHHSYNGSQTFPPCYPGVKWIVAKNIFKVTRKQINQLKYLQNIHGETIQNNVRKLQE